MVLEPSVTLMLGTSQSVRADHGLQVSKNQGTAMASKSSIVVVMISPLPADLFKWKMPDNLAERASAEVLNFGSLTNPTLRSG